MALVSATLGSALASMSPGTDAAAAASALADHLINYLAGASVAGVLANAAVLGGAPKTALHSAMAAGLNAPNGAAAAIAAGLNAFWTSATGLASTIWLVPPNTVVPGSLVPPPSLGGLASALQSTFDSNVNGGLGLSAAANAIANTIHTASLGATVTLQPPSPAPPVVTPIL